MREWTRDTDPADMEIIVRRTLPSFVIGQRLISSPRNLGRHSLRPRFLQFLVHARKQSSQPGPINRLAGMVRVVLHDPRSSAVRGEVLSPPRALYSVLRFGSVEKDVVIRVDDNDLFKMVGAHPSCEEAGYTARRTAAEGLVFSD
jgi:hypothetical protein